MPKHYAFAHPGKIGDALYTLPTIHAICERDDAVADFYTSEVCRPAENLFRYQDHINDFIVPENYVIEGDGQGIQPWSMPVPSGYDRVFQLGFSSFPAGPLHKFIAKSAGLSANDVQPPKYKYPDKKFYDDPYLVMVYNKLRGYPPMYRVYRELLDELNIRIVQTGVVSDHVDGPSDNLTGIDLLDVISLLAGARLYLGFYSAILALANGFESLDKVVTIPAPGTGEQHGLHLQNTYHVYYTAPPASYDEERRTKQFKESLLKVLEQCLGQPPLQDGRNTIQLSTRR